MLNNTFILRYSVNARFSHFLSKCEIKGNVVRCLTLILNINAKAAPATVISELFCVYRH
jgi:hypothetical protein